MPRASVTESLKTAVEHHQGGRLQVAAGMYRKILEADPRHPDAWHLLGLVHHQMGDHETAIDHIRRAIGAMPDIPAFHDNLAAVYLAVRRLDDALAASHRALAIRRDREYTRAYLNLGVGLQLRGDWEGAIQAFRTLIDKEPNHVDARCKLGAALAETGRFDEAIETFHAGLRINPAHAESYYHLARTLTLVGRADEAIAYYRHAIRCNEEHVEAWHNLGCLYADRGEFDEAARLFRRALDIRPTYDELWSKLGNVFTATERPDEAVATFRQAAHVRSDRWAWRLRQAAVCPAVFDSRDEMDAYRRRFESDLEELEALDPRATAAELTACGVHPPMELQYLDGNLRSLKTAYANVLRGCFPEESPRPGSGLPRIGIVVTAGHETLFLKSMGGVLDRVDHRRFQLVVVCPPQSVGRIRANLRNGSIEYVAAAEPTDQMAQAIRHARLDVLVYWEIGTDVFNYLLPFFRLAPMQCTSWGIQVTSGIGQVDYYLSSSLVEPNDAADHYRETLLLASTLLTYQPRPPAPRAGFQRESLGFLPTDHVYFCPQQLGKFHPEFDATLGEILRRDERGVVAVTEDKFGHAARRLERRFARTLPDVVRRIRFVPRLPDADYLGLVAASDVLLDPPHFGGVNTTYDALALGKPIVTRPSAHHRARHTLGCYRKMNYTECVAETPEDYVNLAVRLGTDADYRRAVGQRIAESSDVLFEDLQAVREHERLFQLLAETARAM